MNRGAAGSGGEAGAAAATDGYRALFDVHPAPMWVHHRDTFRFLAVNEAALRLYGYSREDFARMTLLDLRPENERERAAPVRSRTARGELRQRRHRDAHGTVFEVVTYGRDVVFEGAAAVHVIVADSQEIKEAYRQVSESRALLDSIVAHLPIGVFVKDMADDGRYILYNEACAAIVGMAAERIVGHADHAVFSPDQAAEFRRQDAAVLSGRSTFEVEETIPRPCGAEPLVRTVKRALPTPDGSPSRYLLGLSEDVTERRSYESRIAHIAMHDALTGLRNRLFFSERIERMCEAGAPFALLYIDVDRFKHVNDRLGHAAGDALLREVGARLGALAGPDSTVARLGGDEFAILAALDGERGAAEKVARGVLAAFSRPFQIEEAREEVGCSVGVALAPEHGREAADLLRNADMALYAAKGDDRSAFRLYEPAMRARAESRHALTAELRGALAADEFELHYQPILSLGDDRVSGFEALLRWRHPQRGMVSPAEFIPVAEENGLIEAIGQWALREAACAAASWPGGLKVAVNLSPVQFKQVGLLSAVVAALDASGLAPTRLELEITESVLLTDTEQNLAVLRALRALGVRVAMDDFGTGYSSLGYLRSFPFDKIKVDRFFVAGVDSDAGSLAIIRAVRGIAAGFNLATTAEGVETEAQLERLRAEGFQEVQGFLIARPMPADAVAGFLAARDVGSRAAA